MRIAVLLAVVTILGVFLTLAQLVQAAPVSGTVVDKAGQPITSATITVPALRQGAVTDEEGRFTLDLPAGPALLSVSRMGYERARVEILVPARDGAPGLRVQLKDQPVPLAEVTVTTSSFGKTGKSEGAVVRRMDVYTTPGGTGDIFQALRALPGINAPAEGAALFVRGGDPRETVVRLDGGDIGHPYHYEGASGGLFAALDTYMLQSAFFSSGGFSARYGGALSGVLDIESQDPLGLRTVSVGANITGGQVSGTWALVPEKLSFVGSLRLSAPELLYHLYGSPHDYQGAPGSRDAAGKLLYKYSPTGKLSLTYLGANDHVDVRSNYLNYEDLYHETAYTHYASAQLRDVIAGRVAVRAQAALQDYRTDWSFGPVGANLRERNAQASLDAVWPVGSRHELSLGAIYRRPDSRIGGTFPADSTDYQPGAPLRAFNTRVRLDYPGFYAEDKLRVAGPVYATVGARLDYASMPGSWRADPRAALAWRIDEHQTARVAAGLYHQLADPRFEDPAFGNPRLQPLEAGHVIAGYEWKSEHANFRLEGYHKRYRNLVTNDAATFYANGGHGYARGVDVFLQGSRGPLSGWISYGYLDSRRQELDAPHEVRAVYDVTHSLTLVAIRQVGTSWQFGAKANLATGRPYTPVAGAAYDSARGLWRPIYAEKNSARLPNYGRLDARITRLFSLPPRLGLPASGACVLYLEALNVLGTRNVLDYFYNSDYTRTSATESYFSRRFLVGGFTLTW